MKISEAKVRFDAGGSSVATVIKASELMNKERERDCRESEKYRSEVVQDDIQLSALQAKSALEK
ncbi:hypothetical protein [Shewanella sp. 125m-1]